MNAEQLKAELPNYCGSEHWFRHFSGRFNYTEGVQFLADNAGCGCYWLLDLIASHQPTVMRDPSTADFQIWELVVTNGHAVVTCRGDSDIDDTEIPGYPTVVRQEIEYTDFPLPEIKLYLENGVLCLPAER